MARYILISLALGVLFMAIAILVDLYIHSFIAAMIILMALIILVSYLDQRVVTKMYYRDYLKKVEKQILDTPTGRPYFFVKDRRVYIAIPTGGGVTTLDAPLPPKFIKPRKKTLEESLQLALSNVSKNIETYSWGDMVVIKMPHLGVETPPKFRQTIGTLEAAITAAVIAKITEQPTQIERDEEEKEAENITSQKIVITYVTPQPTIPP
ncbi:MAG: hypothetical protein ACK4M3_02450 [Pyrobaculum sp.]